MPENARQLTELLEEKESWNRSVSGLFLSTRLAANQSQTSFAESLDVSQGYISQVENGLRTPSSETLFKLQTFIEGSASGDQDKARQDKEE